MNEVADLLRKAGDLIAVNGHAKGVFRDGKGRLCLFGALREADGYTILGSGVIQVSAAYCGARGALSFRGFDLDWNDEPHRTAGEVVGALYGVAQELREGASW